MFSRLLKPVNVDFHQLHCHKHSRYFPRQQRAPFKLPKILNLNSLLNAIFMFASLKSSKAPLLPGPKLYGCHALLSFDPPEK
jgi:hypothetical protein